MCNSLVNFRSFSFFEGMELLNFTSTVLTEAEKVNFVFCFYVILTKVSVPPEMHELSISVFNC